MSNRHSNVRGREKLDIWSPEARPTCTADILDETMSFIEQQQGKPFYANVWFSDVHATLNPSEAQLEAVSRYKPTGDIDFYGVDQVYLAALLEMDQQIGRFLDKLSALGLDQNTIIIFSSDNGPEDYQIRNSAHSGVGSAGPFRGRKRSIYEGGIRVPFIIRWPDHIPADHVNTTSVVNGVDFLPTIASIIGAKLPEGLILDGENMADVWLGNGRKRQRQLFWEWRYRVFGHVLNRCPMIAVRDGDYKLLLNPDKSRVELYNIIEDPTEMQNLATAEPEMTRALSEAALAWYSTLPESPMDKVAGQNNWNWPE
jgi:arylsulfatase A-like enzyme